MENSKAMVIPVMLKGPNYLLWSRLVKTALGGKGLWTHCTQEAPKQGSSHDALKQTGSKPEVGDKWQQEDLMVLFILQSSLEATILEAYSYCESAKELWDTLHKVYGNSSNLSRVYEVKKAINNLCQEEMEFTEHFGKFRSLWAELDMLRPATIDPATLIERREQDKVFGLLLTLNPTFNDLVKHILRSDKLPCLDEVCSQIQKEQGSHGLFEPKEGLTLANKAEGLSLANKVCYKQEDRRGLKCDHCKKEGHTKERCWILNPHLKPKHFH